MLEQLSGETALYPILGDPIKFVKSPQRMTARFEARGHNGICVPMHVPDGNLESAVHGLQGMQNVLGLLLTMPHKHTMFAYCSTTSETSKLLGVVSVARRNRDGSWHGDMLDGLAFVAALEQQGAKLTDSRVLQIGAGAAGGAIAIALLNEGIRELVLYDINQSRLNVMIRLLLGLGRGHIVAGSPDPTGFDLVVNSSPMGMSPDDPLPVSAHLLNASMMLGDVVAGHGVTPFIQAGQAAGCKTASGLQMNDVVMELMPRFFLEEPG